MDRYGRIYRTEDPEALSAEKRRLQEEDVERLAEFAEKPFEEQLDDWREVIAQRQAKRKAKDEERKGE